MRARDMYSSHHYVDIRRRILVALWIMLAMFFAQESNARAWTTKSRLPNATYRYRTNPNLFVNPPSGGGNFVAGVTASEYNYWIAQAASVWKERTGANISIIFEGTVTRNAEAGCNNHDGINEILAATSCGLSVCDLGADFLTVAANGTLIESDICMFRGTTTVPFNWRLDAGGFPADAFDLLGLLVHEIGHAMGSGDDDSFSVMNRFYVGFTYQRVPAGADVAGMRALYGTRAEVPYWRSKSASGTWSSLSSIPTTTNFEIGAAQGSTGPGTSKIVVASVDRTSTDKLWFFRTNYPLTSSSSWSGVFLAGYVNTTRGAAIAARSSGQQAWVAVAKNFESNLLAPCPGISVIASGDAFSSVVVGSLPDCTMHQPAVAFDSASGRFLLLYVNRDLSENAPDNDRIFARTSLDGWNWSPVQNLVELAFDTPGIACNATGECLMSFSDMPGGRPRLTTRRVLVDSATGVIGVWDGTYDPSSWEVRGPAAAYRPYSSEWTTTHLAASTIAAYADPFFTVYAATSGLNPFGSYSYSVVDSTRHRPVLAGPLNSVNDRLYLFVVK